MDRIKLLRTIDRLAAFLAAGFDGMDRASVRAAIEQACRNKGWKFQWDESYEWYIIRHGQVQAWLQPSREGYVVCIKGDECNARAVDTNGLEKWLDNNKCS